MMKFLAPSFLFLSILGQIVAQSCSSGTCINALNGGTEVSIAKSSRQADCASYFRVTLVPPTSTIIVYQTESSANQAGQPNPARTSIGPGPGAWNSTSNSTVWRRDGPRERGDRSGGTVTLVPSNIPTWASVCGSGPQFSSACVCNGQSYVTITAPTPCVTTTLVRTTETPTAILSVVPTITETVSVTITLFQSDCLAGTLPASTPAIAAIQSLYDSSNLPGQSSSNSGSSGSGSSGSGSSGSGSSGSGSSGSGSSGSGSSGSGSQPGGNGGPNNPKAPFKPGKSISSYGSPNPQGPSSKTNIPSQSGYFNSSVVSPSPSSQSTASSSPAISTPSQTTTSNTPTLSTFSVSSTSQSSISSSVTSSTIVTNSSSQTLPSSSSVTTSSTTTSVSTASSTSSTALPTPPSNSTCQAVDWIISLLSIKSEADDFCSSLLQISPTVQTVTASSTPSPVVVTSTLVQPVTGFVTQTLTLNSTYVTTTTSDVTSVVLSTSIETITDTSSTTISSTSTTVYTTTLTDDVTTTITTTVPYAITDSVDTTSTLLQTTTFYPVLKPGKRTNKGPSPPPSEWNNLGANLLSKACSCLNLTGSTTSTTTTVVFPTPTSTVFASSNFTLTNTVSASTTLSVQSVSNVISTVESTSQVVVPTTTDVTSSTETTTTTITTATDTVTSDISTDTLTTSSVTGTSTTTSVTVTTQSVTVTATPTCGVNLVQNGDFPQPTYAPFIESSTGAASPQFNSGCGVDPYCPLFYFSGAATETLTQTIATFPGQTYTLSYMVANFGYQGAASLSCSVDVPGSVPVAANLNDVTGTTFVKYQGEFTAISTSTTLTCTASTTEYLAANIEAIHIEC